MSEPEIGAKVALPWSRDPDNQDGTYIGHGHFVNGIVAEEFGPVIGYHVWHDCVGGKPQPGGVYLDVPELPGWMREDGRPTWQLISREPLHIEPSVLCRACNDHGFIRGGRWEPA